LARPRKRTGKTQPTRRSQSVGILRHGDTRAAIERELIAAARSPRAAAFQSTAAELRNSSHAEHGPDASIWSFQTIYRILPETPLILSRDEIPVRRSHGFFHDFCPSFLFEGRRPFTLMAPVDEGFYNAKRIRRYKSWTYGQFTQADDLNLPLDQRTLSPAA
jgi:hypothetical protein